MKNSLAAASAELARHWSLPARAAEQLPELLQLLEADRTAPTAVTDPRTALDVHIADSLVALDIGALRRAQTIVDIGSGAGLPGLPLAIALPSARHDLVEASRRKCDFIERAATRCSVPNVRVVNQRVEQWASAKGRERYEAAVARAVAGLATLLEYAAPLLQPGGKLIAWKGSRDRDQEQRGQRAAEQLGMSAEEVLPVKPYPASRERHLHLFTKTGETPASFPRRPGMAGKRPLGD